jgi:glycosyltransferase involved in cell wall biosynthesis
MERRVLFVAYLFPPVGGAGVQRTTKFVKYLPAAGWRPSVLTVTEPSVPLLDHTLCPDVPPDTLVRRAASFEPSYRWKDAVSAARKDGARRAGLPRRVARSLAHHLGKLALQPDPQILWFPRALREGLRLLREVPHEAIFATAPPFSSLLLGAALSRRSGLPLVVDYRDEWDLSNQYYENRRPDRLSRLLQARMQRRVLRQASAVLATTRNSAEALAERCRQAGSAARVGWIYNGYDPDDFAGAEAPRPANDCYRLAYIGTLWNLMSAAPLLAAVRELARWAPHLAARLELVFAGRRTDPQEKLIGELAELPCTVVRHPYVDHHGAIDLMRSADGLLLLLADVPGAERWVPAKTFEYLASRRPIVAAIPPGELREIVERRPGSFVVSPDDVTGLAARLATEIDRHSHGYGPGDLLQTTPPHDRPSQARQLAVLLNSLTDGRLHEAGSDRSIVESEADGAIDNRVLLNNSNR